MGNIQKQEISLIFIFMCILLITPVFAQPPATQINVGQDIGLEVVYPKDFYLTRYSQRNLHFHVYNQTDGVLMTKGDISCLFHLYNSTGNHVIENSSVAMDSNGVEFSIPIPANLTEQIDEYPFIIACNSSTLGGFASGEFITTWGGIPHPADVTLVIFMLLFIVMVVLMVLTIVNVIGHFLLFDVDFMDVAYALCLYFSVFGLRYFNQYYGGIQIIHDFTLLFIRIGAYTHVLIPLFGLALTIIIGQVRKAGKNKGVDRNG